MIQNRLIQLLVVSSTYLICGNYRDRAECVTLELDLISSPMFSVLVSSLEVKMTSNSPVLLGDTLVLNATVYDQNGIPRKDKFCYTWEFMGHKKVSLPFDSYGILYPHFTSNLTGGRGRVWNKFLDLADR